MGQAKTQNFNVGRSFCLDFVFWVGYLLCSNLAILNKENHYILIE